MNRSKLALSAIAAATLAVSGCLTEDPANKAPQINTATNQVSLTALETVSIPFTVSDEDSKSLSISLNSAPTWVTLANNKLIVSPANPDAGTHSVIIEATDGKNVVSRTLSLTVAENNPLPALTDYRQRPLQDEVFYFVMTDRFHDGDTSNNEGDPSDPLASGGLDKTKDGFYHGGDLQGLTEKLSYIEDLGATAIWLTPILKNKAIQGDSAGYHGYWTLDFTSIDPHLGGNDGLKEFIAAAHERNLKVYFDIIVNHSADVIKYEECHNDDGSLVNGVTACTYKSLDQVAEGDDYTPFIPVGEEIAKTPSWLNDIQYYHNQGESTWVGENSIYGDFSGLDDIDTDNPFVVDGFIDVFKDIVNDFRPDGFRVDTVKHVNVEFWQEFTPAILEYARAEDTDGLGTNGAGIENFTLFGEVYSSDANILSYYTTEATLPSVLDFGFQSAIAGVINGDGYVTGDEHPLTTLFNNDDKFNDADSDATMLVNFVGNHDMGRFAGMLGDYLDWEDKAVAKVDLAHAAMYFMRGVPVIYYGAEQGFIGTGGDKAARQDMMPSEVEYYNDTDMLGTDQTSADANFITDHPFYLKWREYSRLLRQHETLRNGVQHIRTSTIDNIYAVSRFDEAAQEEYLIVFNFNSDRSKVASVPALADIYSGVYGIEGDLLASAGNINVSVPASSLVILKATGITDMAAPVFADSGIDGPADGAYVSGLLSYEVNITGAGSRDIPTYTVEMQVSEDAGSTWSTVATDKTYPYTLHYNTKQVNNGDSIQVQFIATNLSADSVTSAARELTVANGTPEITIDYEGMTTGKRAAVTYSNGSTQTYAAEAPFDIEWDMSSDALITFYTPGSGGAVTADEPVWVTRTDVLTNAVVNGDTLLNTLYINVEGDISSTADNDAGTGIQAFDQSNATEIEGTGVRGSLNSWGITEMTYSNGTYHVAITLALDEYGYKFSTDPWDNAFNLGSGVSANGLYNNGSSGNLSQKITTAGSYDFYLLGGDLDGVPGTIEYIHIVDQVIAP